MTQAEVFNTIESLFRELGFANTIDREHHLIHTYNIGQSPHLLR